MWTGSLRLDASVAPEWESPGQLPRCPRKRTGERPVKRFSWKEPPSNVPNDKCEVQVKKGGDMNCLPFLLFSCAICNPDPGVAFMRLCREPWLLCSSRC